MPISLCTGFSQMITWEKAKAVGIRESVMNPMAKSDIAEIIRRVLEKDWEQGKCEWKA
jgi:hypothetical protein